jgi:hypothetical protein
MCAVCIIMFVTYELYHAITVVDNQTQQIWGTYFSTLCKLYHSIQILFLVPMSSPIS